MLGASIAAGVGRFANAIYLLIFNFMLVKFATIEVVGQFFLLYSVALAASMLVTLGGSHYNIKWMTRLDVRDASDNVGGCFFVVLLVGFGVYSLFAVSSFIFFPVARFQSYVLVSVWVFTGALRLQLGSVARFFKCHWKAQFIESINFNVLSIGFLIIFLASGRDISIDALLVMSVISSLASLLYGINFFSTLSASSLNLSLLRLYIFASLKMLAVFGFPLLCTTVMLWSASIGYDESGVALLGFAHRVMQVVALPLMVFTVAIKSYVLSDSASDRNLQSKYSRINFWLTLVIGVFLSVSSEYMLVEWFGSEYSGAVEIIWVLVVGRVFLAWFGPIDVVNSYRGSESDSARVAVIIFVFYFIAVCFSLVIDAPIIVVPILYSSFLLMRAIALKLFVVPA